MWQIWRDISLWFWFAFFWWLVKLDIFSYTFVSLCLRNVYSTTLPILKIELFIYLLLLSFRGSLYILVIIPLSDIWLVTISSHSTGCFSFLEGRVTTGHMKTSGAECLLSGVWWWFHGHVMEIHVINLLRLHTFKYVQFASCQLYFNKL